MEVGTSSVQMLPYAASSVGVARRRLIAELTDAGVFETTACDAGLVLSELISNALRHARPLPGSLVRVCWELGDGFVEVAVSDGGGATVPAKLPWEDLERNRCVLLACCLNNTDAEQTRLRAPLALTIHATRGYSPARQQSVPLGGLNDRSQRNVRSLRSLVRESDLRCICCFARRGTGNPANCPEPYRTIKPLRRFDGFDVSAIKV